MSDNKDQWQYTPSETETKVNFIDFLLKPETAANIGVLIFLMATVVSLLGAGLNYSREGLTLLTAFLASLSAVSAFGTAVMGSLAVSRGK